MNTAAPIAFFAYKRPDHALKALESIASCHGACDSELFIFCDGPKGAQDKSGVEAVRRAVRSKQWCGKVTIIEREENCGCANNVMRGVTQLCDQYGKVIVVEDDLLVSQHFLSYMNEGLSRYEHCEQVMQISGYMFPLLLDVATDAVLLPLTTSWGWGTWKRAWDRFDPHARRCKEIGTDKNLLYRFNLNGSYPYYQMLEAQLGGSIDSWAIRFHYSVFVNDGLVLHPKKSLVSNIGFDDSGTHCGIDSLQGQKISDFEVRTYPSPIICDCKAKTEVFKYLFFKENGKSIVSIIKYYLKEKSRR